MTNHTSSPTLFDAHYKALVIGASGAIGGAFVAAFQADPRCTQVTQLSRSQSVDFDLLNESSIQQQSDACRAYGPYHIIIDATGALTIDGVGPEKSLSSLREDTLMKNFHINAVAPVLVLRHFAPLLAPGPSVYAKLSARVGSISDNVKGGWYGYRAAKAALNMLLQTAAIELQRKNPALRVVALQPGTVRSNLSQAFANSVPHLLEPAESVAGMLSALKTLAPKSGAHYLDYKGVHIDW
jgi:NAD(P)-dependent dehydrogenase (short-subunit alcohol dehydrogenase family)